jgi:TadE-like protein
VTTLHARRRSGERGAVLVEMAIVVPLLALFVLGIVECGFAWRANVTLTNAARAGARVGSSSGNERLADYNILQAVRSGLSDFDTSRIDRIVVFKATSPDGGVPSTCREGSSVSGVCNVYSAADLTLGPSSFGEGTTTCTGSPDASWCPTSREVRQGAGPDYVGVYLQVRHALVTSLLPLDDFTMEGNAVMRAEPKATQ